MVMKRILLLAGLALGAAAVAPAQDGFNWDGRPETLFMPKTDVVSTDKSFAELTKKALLLLRLGVKRADENATDEWTKTYNKELSDELTFMVNDLDDSLRRAGLELGETKLSKTQQKFYNDFVRGGSFDMSYVSYTRDLTAGAATLFAAFIKQGTNTELRGFAVKNRTRLLYFNRLAKERATQMGIDKKKGNDF
ncbi:DUF4142 domain-containing protein [bacterium]|nr:MAG: DUF4142 domain-containing protein [bacterium]